MPNVICAGQNTAYVALPTQLFKAKVTVRLSEKITAIKSQNPKNVAITLSSYIKEAILYERGHIIYPC